MWNRLQVLLGFKGVAPRVEQVITASMVSAASIFYVAASLLGVNQFDLELKRYVAAPARDLLTNPVTLAPTVILVTAVGIGLLLSFVIIDRARRRGSIVISSDGVLHHYNQVNISMRVETFHMMLLPVAQVLSGEQLDKAFYEGGLRAGKAFAVVFPLTYQERIQKMGMPDWSEVDFEQRLRLWKRNDETSGWGDIDVNYKPGERLILVQVEHPMLFRGTIGNAWSSFMAGYVEAFLNDVAKPRGGIHFDRGRGMANHGSFISLEFSRS